MILASKGALPYARSGI